MASKLVPRRGVSSFTTPLTGTISRSKRPESMAWQARSLEVSAKRSMSKREKPHFSAIISAELNWVTKPSPKRATQPGEPVKGSPNP